MLREPALREYRLDMTSKRSEVFFTGKNRVRGTFMPVNRIKFVMIQKAESSKERKKEGITTQKARSGKRKMDGK